MDPESKPSSGRSESAASEAAPSLRSRLGARAYRLGKRIQTPVARLLARLTGDIHVFSVVVAILVGLLAGYGAIAFRHLLAVSHLAFFSASDYTLALLHELPCWRRLLTPVGGGLLVGLLITRLAPEVQGSGIPEVMEAVAKRVGLIRVRVLLVKALAAALTIGSGGSAGREGPIVHIGSAIGSAVGQFLEVPPRRLTTTVACGAAAGIAATFNAPIAGALFSMEVVLGGLEVTSLSPIVISSVVATVVSRHHLGDFPAFQVPDFRLVSASELGLYALLGLLAGLLAVLFIRALYAFIDLGERLPLLPWLRPAAGGLGVGIIGIWFPHVFGVGYETLAAIFNDQLPTALLAALILLKLLATSLSLGSGGSGGVFAPSLFIGAALGGTFGRLVNRLFPLWTAPPGAYATVGMGALVAATTHAPISAILIIFELTNEYPVIAPLMLTCVVSVLVSSRLHRESIYTAKLARRGVRLYEGRDVNLLRSISVGEVMSADPPTVAAGAPFSELVPRLLTGSHRELWVVERTGRLKGAVSLTDIKESVADAETLGALVVAADVANTRVPFVVPGDSLDLVMHLFGRSHRDELPVCADARSRRVVGVVTRDALIDAYNRRLFQVDLTGGFNSLMDAVSGGRTVDVVGGVQLAEVPLPLSLVGLTLRQANLRQTHDLEVVLIRTEEEDAACLEGRPAKLPAAETVLHPGDRLLVIGTPEAIARLRG